MDDDRTFNAAQEQPQRQMQTQIQHLALQKPPAPAKTDIPKELMALYMAIHPGWVPEDEYM